MRVLFDCLYTLNRYTGMDTYCKFLAKNYRLLAPTTIDKPDIYHLLKKEDSYWLEKKDKVVYWSPIYKRINPYLFYKRKYIIHATYTFSKFFNAKWFNNQYAKKILTVHDLNYLVELPPKKQKYFNDALFRNVIVADHIVCVSKTTQRVLLNQFPKETKGKTSVIYNGVDEYTIPLKTPAFNPKFQFIFFVGWVSKKKNVHAILPILQNNDLHFIIAGVYSCNEDYAKKIKNEAKKLGVEKKVHLIGPVSENDKHWYFKHCKAFVFPSIAEGFGLPVVEAMHYGVPCLSSNLEALREVYGDVAYYFDNYDPDYLQYFFKECMEHYKKNKLQKKIIARAKMYSWKKVAKEYLELYSKVIRK